MMRGLGLQELAAKIEGNRTGKHDFIAPTTKLEMVPAPADPPGRRITLATPEGVYPVRKLAHDQIAARLNIPVKYYERMYQEQPELLAQNVNTWFRANPEPRLVRTIGQRQNGGIVGGEVRAFLSNRYQRIENEEVAEQALKVLADFPEVQVVSAEVTERRMYIQAVTPRVKGELKRGDEVQAGVIISNSEVGFGAVSVASVIWRLMCLNGMVMPNKFRANHVGRRIDDNEALWAEDTVAADDKAILLKVRDSVRNAVDEVKFRERIEQMTGLTERKITGNPTEVVEVLSQKVGANDSEKGGILRSLIEGGDLSAWGLLNAVTAQAHSAKDYDRAVELEQAGGQLLELPRSQWAEILTAEDSKLAA